MEIRRARDTCTEFGTINRFYNYSRNPEWKSYTSPLTHKKGVFIAIPFCLDIKHNVEQPTLSF